MRSVRGSPEVETRGEALGLARDAVAAGILPPLGRTAVLLFFHLLASPLASAAEATPPVNVEPVTFARHIAPLIYQRCAPCHRPGAAGPFTLLSHADAAKHLKEIVDLTARRVMPPWLPEPGHGEFRNERRLTDAEIALFARWQKAGAPEGNPADLPPAPVFPDGWQLGAPDLVVTLPAPYELGPEGRDLYRNFVAPLPLVSNRFVRAIEFQPGNPAIHHARIMLDQTGQSRRLEKDDGTIGFPGMNPPAKFPPGHMLTWAPGRQPYPGTEGLSWLLEKGNDVVFQLHLQRTGKKEVVRPKVAFYFTDRPPARTPFRFGLLSQTIDIPAGATNHETRRSFTLPAEVELLAVMPHAHYLGKAIEFTATPPGGAPRSLLRIGHWDFNWQDEYRYAQPVVLPAGTRLDFRITFDNSAANPHNPNQPPKRVVYGPQSADEMAEIWFQVIPRDAAGFAALQRAYKPFDLEEGVARFEKALREDPRQAGAHLELGKLLGALDRKEEGARHLVQAVELDPGLADGHHYLGVFFMERQQWPEAREAFEYALQLNPGLQRTHVALALTAINQGRQAEAEAHLKTALELNPADQVTRAKLEELGRASPR